MFRTRVLGSRRRTGRAWRPLEQKFAAIGHQLPGQAQARRGGRMDNLPLVLDSVLIEALFRVRGETPICVGRDRGPGLQDVAGRPGGQGGLVQKLAPDRERVPDLLGPLVERAARSGPAASVSECRGVRIIRNTVTLHPPPERSTTDP